MAPVFGAREFAQMRRVAADAVVRGLPQVLSDLAVSAHPLKGRFFELPANARTLAPGLTATRGDMWSCGAILDVSTGPAAPTRIAAVQLSSTCFPEGPEPCRTHLGRPPC